MEVYHCPPERIRDGIAVLESDEFHHLARVMRHGVGAEIHIADGEGMMYHARVAAMNATGAECIVSEPHAGYNEPRLHVSLVFSLLKNPGRMDWLIEKATELGVSRFVPVITRRTQARHAKTARWRDLALAAMKQCCRCRLPRIEDVREFPDVFALLAGSRIVLFHEEAKQPLGHVTGQPDASATTMALCIGPEGGFTPEEVALAVEHGADIRSLGSRRLRAETAAVAALARVID